MNTTEEYTTESVMTHNNGKPASLKATAVFTDPVVMDDFIRANPGVGNMTVKKLEGGEYQLQSIWTLQKVEMVQYRERAIRQVCDALGIDTAECINIDSKPISSHYESGVTSIDKLLNIIR